MSTVELEPAETKTAEREAFTSGLWTKAVNVRDFIQATLTQLDAKGLRHSDLAALWGIVLDDLADANAVRRRKLEAQLGFDPEECPPEALEAALGWENQVGEGASPFAGEGEPFALPPGPVTQRAPGNECLRFLLDQGAQCMLGRPECRRLEPIGPKVAVRCTLAVIGGEERRRTEGEVRIRGRGAVVLEMQLVRELLVRRLPPQLHAGEKEPVVQRRQRVVLRCQQRA